MVERLGSRDWRLRNLYYIRDENGNKVRFVPNDSQQKLLDDLHNRNLILKARQLGFTTAIQILMLDECLWTPFRAAGVIAHNKEDAEAFFTDKIRFAFDNIDDDVRPIVPTATQDSVRSLRFSNGSSIRVGTSLRSGTFQLLHISEYGKLCAKYPEKAREVKTGALNTVHSGQFICVESTAEGRGGDFFEKCEEAKKNTRHSSLDWKFHFFPWWKDAKYSVDPDGVLIPDEKARYFDALAAQGIDLTDGQKAWYVLKEKEQGDDMKREFPSTPDEAFESTVEGAYFKRQIAQARTDGRIGRVPYDPALQVNTFWDLGMNDSMCIWLHQSVGLENRFIGYYENTGEGIEHYAWWLDQWARDRHATFGEHYMPHDANVRELGTGKTRKRTAEDKGISPIAVVPRTENKLDDIQAARNIFPSCWFDEAACGRGIEHLSNYRKAWDEVNSVFKQHPLHNEASHGADGFLTFATGWEPMVEDDEDDYEHGSDRSAIAGY